MKPSTDLLPLFLLQHHLPHVVERVIRQLEPRDVKAMFDVNEQWVSFVPQKYKKYVMPFACLLAVFNC